MTDPPAVAGRPPWREAPRRSPASIPGSGTTYVTSAKESDAERRRRAGRDRHRRWREQQARGGGTPATTDTEV